MSLFGRRAPPPEPHRIVQYVGDETLLLYGKDEVFIYVDARDASLTPSVLRDDTWEPAITAFLQQRLLPGQCFIDIGANNGIHSLRAARMVGPTGVVVAFEPQQRLFALLQRSVCANGMMGYVWLQRKAIGADSGEGRLGKFAHLTGSATLTTNSQIIDVEDVLIVSLPAALSDIAQEIGRPIEPDVIKIDVEGFEYHVWNGMKEWSRTRERLTIVIEFSPVSYRDMGQDPSELLAEFREYGFSLEALLPDGQTIECTPEDLDRMASARAQFDLILAK